MAQITGLDGEVLTLEPVKFSHSDLQLEAGLKFHGFQGRCKVWVEGRTWERFLEGLSLLEQQRRGEAELEAMSPNELGLTFRILDQAGHVGVEGFLGAHGRFQRKLTFSAFPFEPSEVPGLLRELRHLRSTLWNVLHDGVVIGISSPKAGEVLLLVSIPYLLSEVVSVTLEGCSRFVYRPFIGREETDLAVIASLKPEILSARMQGNLCQVCCERGTLEFVAEGEAVALDGGRILDLPQLTATARDYWTDLR